MRGQLGEPVSGVWNGESGCDLLHVRRLDRAGTTTLGLMGRETQ
jgi:hypothetical protein